MQREIFKSPELEVRPIEGSPGPRLWFRRFVIWPEPGAELLGVTRHALKRRIVKHNIRWKRRLTSTDAPAMPEAAPS